MINAAFLGKNMYFSSVTQIQSPNQTPSGNGDGLSIMKRNLGENNARNRYHPLASEFGDNQRQFIQVRFYARDRNMCSMSGAAEPHGTLGTRPNLILGNELPFPKI